jgi:arylsulfatase A-like enzyme
VRKSRGPLVPALTGALYVLALAAVSGRQGDDAALGDKAEAVSHFIEAKFATDVAKIATAIGGAAVGIGLLVGLLAYALMWARGAHRSHLSRFLVESLAVVVAVHASFLAMGMARSPQLYVASFYAKGGPLRTIQVVVTDVLGPGGVRLGVLAALALYVFGPGGRSALVRPLVARAILVVRGRFRRFAPLALVVVAAPKESPAPRPSESSPAALVPPHGELGVRPNVLVIAADSLRADRIGPETTPNLFALSQKAVVFERAYVSVPRTFSSWVNILTGRHAHHHGVRSMFPRWEERAKDLDAAPHRFVHDGYRTQVLGDYAADIFGRVDLGFQKVDTPSFDFRQLLRQRGLERETPLLPFLHSHTGRALFPVLKELSDAADADLLADETIAALRSSPRPFFDTVFFSTAHFPYAAPAPYYRTFTDASYRGRYKYHKPVGLGGELPPDEADVRQIRALYDGAVLSIDAAIGRVLDALAQQGLAGSTIVVVTADHGETLYENGHGQGHGDHLFGDEGTHVPLIVYDPRIGAPRRVPDIVRDVDIAPTLYALAGVPQAPALDGASLVPLMHGEASEKRFAFAETELWFTEEIAGVRPDERLPYPGIMQMTELDSAHGQIEVVLQKAMIPVTLVARHRMVRDERFKLVYVPTRKGAMYRLFDTATDPSEVHDVARERPAEVERLRGVLWKWMLEDRGMTQKDGLLVPREDAP